LQRKENPSWRGHKQINKEDLQGSNDKNNNSDMQKSLSPSSSKKIINRIDLLFNSDDEINCYTNVGIDNSDNTRISNRDVQKSLSPSSSKKSIKRSELL
jgi:hypothetical protein